MSNPQFGSEEAATLGLIRQLDGSTDAALAAMSKDERSLLLFFETAATDYGGTFDARHLNSEDMDIATRWNELRFITFQRIPSCLLPEYRHGNSQKSHYVVLSEGAWRLAHAERRARSARLTPKVLEKMKEARS